MNAPRAVQSGELRLMAMQCAAATIVLHLLYVWRDIAWLQWPTVLLGCCTIAGLARPAILLPLYQLSKRVTLTARRIMAHGLLAALFVLVVTPLALAARLFGRRFIERPKHGARTSYWKPASPLRRRDYEQPF
jgi:hypothetical protein